MTVTIDQNSSTVSAGTNFTLTCVTELPAEVDTNITVNINWMGPAGNTLPSSNTYRLMAGIPASRYESILMVNPVTADQFGNYSCTATVNSDPPSSFITASEGSVTLTIIGKDILVCILHYGCAYCAVKVYTGKNYKEFANDRIRLHVVILVLTKVISTLFSLLHVT